MSGSDDLNLILWRATMFKDVATISTGHRGNIFSAKVDKNLWTHFSLIF